MEDKETILKDKITTQFFYKGHTNIEDPLR